MSPASKGDNSGDEEQETPAETTDAAHSGAADSRAGASEAAEADSTTGASESAEADSTTGESESAEGAATADAESAAEAEPAAEAKQARRRAATSSDKETTGEEAKPAAAKPATARAAGRAPRGSARAPAAKKAKAQAASTEVKVDLPADIFDAKVNVPLIHQVVVAQQAAARQGTHATKTRGEVRGGGRKPYRQKGTGRARQGSVRAPQFTGGGIVHGPVPRSHAQKTPKKMKVAALRGALSDRARHGLVQVVDGFIDGDSPKTAHAVSVLAAVTGQPAGTASVLVVVDRSDELTWKSLRNARGVHVIDPGQLSSYDVLVRDRVVFTKPAFESFVARVGAGAQEGGDR